MQLLADCPVCKTKATLLRLSNQNGRVVAFSYGCANCDNMGTVVRKSTYDALAIAAASWNNESDLLNDDIPHTPEYVLKMFKED